MSDVLLSVENLTTVFDVPGRPVVAADHVSFQIRQGETLGLVGESGSGKSVTAFSILRLLDSPGRIAGGRVVFQGRDLLSLPDPQMRHVRGAGIGLIFQEPMAALNPVMRIGNQIGEALRVHGMATKREARERAIELLRAVRISDPGKRVDDYPHQLSGGMRQRVMIAVALACRPGPWDRKAFYRELRSRASTDEFRWALDTAARLRPSDSVAVLGNSLEAHRSVATALACSRASVYAWVAAWRQAGLAGLAEGEHRGRARRLDAVAEQHLIALLAQDPQTRGYHATGWTVALLRTELARAGTQVSDRTLRRTLHRLGYRWKRPRYVYAGRATHLAQKKGLWSDA